MRRTANDIANRDQSTNRDQNPVLKGGVYARGGPRAFTVVELIVVIVIIGLILAIVLPGLAKMTSDARFSSASQSVQAAFTRAYVAAQSDRNMTAIRFVPDVWELNPDSDETEPTGRQQMVTYTYRTSTDLETAAGEFVVEYRERLTRREGSQSVQLPANVWVAPAVTLERDGNGLTTTAADLLVGDVGDFRLDPAANTFYSPDDFLVVFDPQTGVRGGVSTGRRGAWPRFQMAATDMTTPASPRESAQVERFNFSGIVIYKREPFLALGASASADDRQDVLRRIGRPYFVHRYSGGLVMGSRDTQ
ncbi:MAG: prepilin-type N-terminal cleavage/methylation domain-containing protein [Planctomycetes bacterium]|nr:prepilin-type N-terminal cleavage/methylation domain-containing protein [Planctomycetota bacterium]